MTSRSIKWKRFEASTKTSRVIHHRGQRTPHWSDFRSQNRS